MQRSSSILSFNQIHHLRIFLKRAGAFIGIHFLLIGLLWAGHLGIAAYKTKKYNYSNSNTALHVYTIPENQHFDLLIMGSSRAEAFLRSQNHFPVEEILDKEVFNIARGGGGGIVPEQVYLSYFLNRGNRADTIIYFIDAWALFSPQWNEDNPFYSGEPITASFLLELINHDIPTSMIIEYYVRNKFTKNWIDGGLIYTERDTNGLDRIDPEAIKKRFQVLYPDGLNHAYFEKYSRILSNIVIDVQKKDMTIIFIKLPTLLGDEPGDVYLDNLLKEFKNKYGVEHYDFSQAVKNPKFFTNHDHLNSPGVEYFTEKYLKQILDP